MQLTIREEFRDLLTKPADAEFEELTQSILAEGCREPIIIWKREDKHVIIDGHNRYSICHNHGIDFKTQEIAFSSDDEAKQWIIANQCARRNLTPKQKEQMLAKKLEFMNRLPDALEPAKLGDVKKITMREADEAGVSRDTASKLNQVAKHAPELLDDIADGKVSVNKAHKTIKPDEGDLSNCSDDEIAAKIAEDLRTMVIQIGSLAVSTEKYAKIETSCKQALREVAIKLEKTAELK